MSEPGSRPPIRWILALVGMLVVPIAGLAWAAFSGGPPDVTAESDGETAASDEPDEEAEATTSTSGAAKSKKKKSKKKKKPKAGSKKVLHKAAPCCEALRKAGREEPDVSKRPTFLAAASACEAAPTSAKAMTQVKSIVEGSRLELPSECSD